MANQTFAAQSVKEQLTPVEGATDDRMPIPQKYLYTVKTRLDIRLIVKRDEMFTLLETIGTAEHDGEMIDFAHPIRNGGKGARGYARAAVNSIVEAARVVNESNIRYLGTPEQVGSEIQEIAATVMQEYNVLTQKVIEPDVNSGFSIEMRDLISGTTRSLISGEFLKTVNLDVSLSMYAPVMLKPKALENISKIVRSIDNQFVKARLSLVFDPSNFTVSPEFLALFNAAFELNGYTKTVNNDNGDIVVHLEPIVAED